MAPKTQVKKVNNKFNTLAERMITEFKLVKDKEFIRFKDGPSTLTNALAEAGRDMALKYGTTNTQSPPADLIHTSSFLKNPLRYIFQMIDQCEVSQHTKKARKKKVREIVKIAMRADPLPTVQSIVYSMARIARF